MFGKYARTLNCTGDLVSLSFSYMAKSVQIFVDGVKSAGFPFAGFFIPSGAIGPSLHIGGIVAASSELFPTLLTYHPFIGSLNGVSLSGTPIDFTAHVALEAAILDLPFCKSINRSCVDECFFNGKSFAEFGESHTQKHVIILSSCRMKILKQYISVRSVCTLSIHQTMIVIRI